jgi:hypothetical protein
MTPTASAKRCAEAIKPGSRSESRDTPAGTASAERRPPARAWGLGQRPRLTRAVVNFGSMIVGSNIGGDNL